MSIYGTLGLCGLLASLAGFADATENHESILSQRYGVNAEQLRPELPASAAGTQTRREVPTPSRFPVQPEAPWVQIRFADEEHPEPTGDPSLDHAAERASRHCKRMKAALTEKGSAAGANLRCD
ncbi:hypothetical protein [Pseudomonas sp. RIT-PI-AD]|uniref:hypothetical protein n=1 Tax=Pseudomonas sp. RIT-PI-AD TaxID=3035294 RepID=UPI0021DAB2D7|nr:hypothetical protein [Pseudomonas sp. RIT-PI-AD]